MYFCILPMIAILWWVFHEAGWVHSASETIECRLRAGSPGVHDYRLMLELNEQRRGGLTPMIWGGYYTAKTAVFGQL
jgi:hypothetical protein